MKSTISKNRVIEVCTKNQSMARAAADLNVHFNTLKKWAIIYKCYNPNQGLKGGNKNAPAKIDLEEILNGYHPYFQTYKLKNRLLKEGLIDNVCSVCGLVEWNSKSINLELDHIDGNRLNHIRSNLRMLCPNCHSQTETYRSKNRHNNPNKI